ncbi:MAG: PilZ domain-containing protein, partial [Sedimenticola sp.]
SGQDPLSNGLLYQTALPLSWESVSDAATEPLLLAAEERNERMLQTLITLQEHHLEPQEEEQDRDRDRAPELARIEAKLDMLLELVSQLRPQQEPGEKRFSLRLGTGGISWEVKSLPLPKIDESLVLHLQLDERLPKPLELYGRVITVEKVGDGDAVTLKFTNLGQRVTDLLGKVIFRQHRREIALIRSRPLG